MREFHHPICQGCGKTIDFGEPSVKVEYGKLGCTAHPHAKIVGKGSDWFHQKCDKAFREEA